MREDDPTKNTMDFALEDLEIVFLQDDKTIQSIINRINKKGVNFNARDLSELLPEVKRSATNVLDAFAWLIHAYSHHKDRWEESKSNYKSDKVLVNKLLKFVSQIMPTGLLGLNTLFELNRSEFFNRETIARFRSEDMLKTIHDENAKPIGYLPYTKITFEFADESGETKYVIANLGLRGLRSVIKALEETLEVSKDTARVYRDKLGENVIFEEDVK